MEVVEFKQKSHKLKEKKQKFCLEPFDHEERNDLYVEESQVKIDLQLRRPQII
jgi:hypothetical protein